MAPPFGAERWGHTIFWPHLSDRTKVLEKLFVCFIFFLAPSKDVNFTHEWAQFRILSIWRSASLAPVHEYGRILYGISAWVYLRLS